MLNQLAGRLTWEPTGEGIRVDIPARCGWTIIFNFVWLIGWAGAGWLAVNRIHEGHGAKQIPLIWLVGWAAGMIFMIATILWSFTGRTTLELNSYQLKISRQGMGLRTGTRVCANADIRDLRFVPNMIRGRSNIPSHISYEENGRTRSFASAVAEPEALALFGKMDEVYKFPRGSRASTF